MTARSASARSTSPVGPAPWSPISSPTYSMESPWSPTSTHSRENSSTSSGSPWPAPAPRGWQNARRSVPTLSTGILSQQSVFNGPGHKFSRNTSGQNSARVQKFSHSRQWSTSSNNSISTAASTSSCISKSALISHHTSSDNLLRHYEMIKELGNGSFSRVALVCDARSSNTEEGGEERVCKTVTTNGLHKTVVEWLKAEIDVLCALDHPNIVKLYEFAEDRATDQLVMILEYVPGDTCVGLIEKRGKMGESFVARLIRQVLVAIAYCHSRGVVHRDLKLENVMLTRMSTKNNPDCKIIDFGLGGYKHSRSMTSGDFVGTPQYMAPEVVHREVGDFCKVDVWAIGVCAYELLTGKNLFGPPTWQQPKQEEIQEIYDKIDAFVEFTGFGSVSCSSEAFDFVGWLLEREGHRRTTATQASDHPWLDKHRVDGPGLTGPMVISMTSFVSAHPILRLCSLILATRTDLLESDKIGSAFLSLDADGDGEVTAEDLREAFMDSNWLGLGLLDSDTILRAADFDQSGGMSFTEFLAACSYKRHGSPADIARQAFEALDDDRDGFVRLSVVQSFVPLEDGFWLQSLPEHCRVEEWCTCIEKCVTMMRPHTARRQHSACDSPIITNLQAIGTSMLDSVFGNWLCQGNAGARGEGPPPPDAEYA
mmetsp:Transcript_54608/g.97974  ORF Transcript_54608/g.97974 Transcript_54608/m.97974 type:complete len:654 (-) Transcript_54608:17-1978(-)